MMDTAEVIQVIRTTLLRRGNGRDTPIRVVTQFWSLDGELLCEVDPLPEDEQLEEDSFSPRVIVTSPPPRRWGWR